MKDEKSNISLESIYKRNLTPWKKMLGPERNNVASLGTIQFPQMHYRSFKGKAKQFLHACNILQLHRGIISVDKEQMHGESA